MRRTFISALLIFALLAFTACGQTAILISHTKQDKKWTLEEIPKPDGLEAVDEDGTLVYSSDKMTYEALIVYQSTLTKEGFSLDFRTLSSELYDAEAKSGKAVVELKFEPDGWDVTNVSKAPDGARSIGRFRAEIALK